MKNYSVKFQDRLEMNTFDAQFLKHNDHFYKVRIWGHGSFVITDLTNAGKRGAVCPELSVNSSHDAPDCAYWNDLLADHIKELLNATTSKTLPTNLEKPYFKFFFREVESKRRLAIDLSTVKPLKEEPKKWTIPHVVRAIVNGQYEGLRCNYLHFDDTCEDFGKGEIKDPINFVRKIVEDPSGWWTSKDTDGVVKVCCHTFDSNRFVPKIETAIKKKREAKKVTKQPEKPEVKKTDSENISLEDARKILEVEGVRVEETMTEPKRAGKKPRQVWQVSGRTNGLEQVFYDLGCSRRRWRGAFSFWDGDPSLEIAQAILDQGRLSFEEQQERKEERAERRAERYEQYSDNALKKSEQLDKTNKAILDCMNGTPILIGHHSEKRHRRDLERIDNRIRRSIEETKKAEYYQGRVTHIDFKLHRQKKDLGYLHNRIAENEARLRKLERDCKGYSDFESRKKEVEEKLSYFKKLRNQVIEEQKENGRIIPSPLTIDKEDLVKYRGTWYPVVRVNKKTVTFKNWLGIETFTWKAAFDEISDIKKHA